MFLNQPQLHSSAETYVSCRVTYARTSTSLCVYNSTTNEILAPCSFAALSPVPAKQSDGEEEDAEEARIRALVFGKGDSGLLSSFGAEAEAEAGRGAAAAAAAAAHGAGFEGGFYEGDLCM